MGTLLCLILFLHFSVPASVFMSLNHAIHDIVHNLHILQQYQDTTFHQESTFRLLLESVVHALCSLLRVDTAPSHLQISTDVFGKLTWALFHNAHPDFPTHASIFEFLRSAPPESHSARLLLLLRDLDLQARLKEPYSSIWNHLSKLVLLFAQRHKSSEKRLVDYVARCFAYEYAYLLGLQSQLDDVALDTENLAHAVDSFLRRHDRDQDSFHNYDEAPQVSRPLNFSSNIPSFSLVYHMFLELSLFKSHETPDWDMLTYAKVSVDYFRSSHAIEHMDAETLDLYQIFCDFFLGSESEDGLLSENLHDIAREVLLLYFESISLSPLQNTELKDLSRAQLVELVSNLDAVVSILNEYDLDFNPQFPQFFKHYLFLVYEDLAHYASSQDYSYIGEILDTVRAIADFENSPLEDESDLIRNIVHKLHSMQFSILLPRSGLSLLMRLAVKDMDRLTSLLRNAFTHWNYRLLGTAQLHVLYEDRFLPGLKKRQSKRFFSIWYNKKMRYSDLTRHAASYSDKKLLAKYLTSNWIEKLLQLSQAEMKGEVFQIKPRFNIWRRKFKVLKDLEKRLVDLANAKALRFSFTRLKLKVDKVGDLEDTAADFHTRSASKTDIVLLKECFLLWSHKLHSGIFTPATSSEKLSRLGELNKGFVLRKHFRSWRQRTLLLQAGSELEKRSRFLLKHNFLHLWQVRLQQHYTYHLHVTERDRRLTANAFSAWKTSLRHRTEASEYYKRNLFKRAFKQWRLSFAFSNSAENRQRKDVILAFQTWKLATKSNQFQFVFNSKLKTYAFDSWADSSRKISENNVKAITAYEINLLRKHLLLWGSRLNMNSELITVADLNFQRKYLNKMVGKSSKHRKQEKVASQVLQKRMPLEERMTTGVILRKWKDQYLRRFEDLSRKAVCDFEQGFRNKNTTRLFFKFWRRRLKNVHQHQKNLHIRLEHFSGMNEVGKHFFERWVERTASQHHALEQSKNFYNNLLYKKYLLAWYEKYVTKVDYLADIAEEMIGQKDYMSLLESLRKWNLKLIKIVKRNNQTCAMFREKWEKANAKSLFELWLHKTRQRELLLDDEQDGEYIEANSTFGSSLSPLFRKNPKPTSNSVFDTASYLNTPVKKQVQGLFTPQHRKGPSPTKLQETNQRMKVDRMDALINRYKLAKKPSRSLLQNRVRLSPPKLKTDSTLPMKPPAPRFETHSSSSSPEATSSPEAASSSTLMEDSALWSTAKKLNRIKPLVIPPHKEDNEFRLMSVSNLRARLTRNSSSNVFDDNS